MNIKRLFRWNWQNSYISLVVLYSIMIFILCFFSVVNALAPSEGSVSGLSMASSVMLFVLGIVLFSQSLRFGVANGASRRSIFIGFAVFIVSMTLAVTVIDLLLRHLFLLFGMSSVDIVGTLYMEFGTLKDGLASEAAVTICRIVATLAFSAFGFFVGGAYYRMNKPMRIIVSVGVPLLLAFGLPLTIGLLPAPARDVLSHAFVAFLEFLMKSPYNMALVSLGFLLLFAILSWLLMRRAPIKAAN